MEVQESKKHLAGVLLSPHNAGQTDDSLGGLHVCAQQIDFTLLLLTCFAEVAVIALIDVLLPATLEHESNQSCMVCLLDSSGIMKLVRDKTLMII